MIMYCLGNITTLRFDFLHSFRYWYGNPLLFETQNPEISGFSTAHVYKYKTKQQAKMKRKQELLHRTNNQQLFLFFNNIFRSVSLLVICSVQ